MSVVLDQATIPNVTSWVEALKVDPPHLKKANIIMFRMRPCGSVFLNKADALQRRHRFSSKGFHLNYIL